jgi:hypothetical protein
MKVWLLGLVSLCLVGVAGPVHADAGDGSSTSAATVTAAPAAQPSDGRRMGWFGVGARLGITELRLVPPASLVSGLDQIGGGAASPDQFALRSNVTTVTPTLHLGGSGLFLKLDLPISFGSSFTMVGLGLYPINFGIYFDRFALFPYLSFGGVASVVTSHATPDPGTSNKLIGGVVQARAAAGLKYFPLHDLALSGEVGYSPWNAGAVALPPGSGSSSAATHFEGGFGSILDLALGVEWL